MRTARRSDRHAALSHPRLALFQSTRSFALAITLALAPALSHTGQRCTHSFAVPQPRDSKGGKGKRIIGALNYIVQAGGNVVSFLTYNYLLGDGGDVWPLADPSNSKVRACAHIAIFCSTCPQSPAPQPTHASCMLSQPLANACQNRPHKSLAHSHTGAHP